VLRDSGERDVELAHQIMDGLFITAQEFQDRSSPGVGDRVIDVARHHF
jgi:hypothetical protein